MDTGCHTPASVSFGRFQISPPRREFLTDGRPVEIGGRAFDVLMTLIDAQGAGVSKNALMERVWPDRIVEENNLQSQISALRSAFGADRDLIRTVSGRGYQFTGEIRVVQAPFDECADAARLDSQDARLDARLPGEHASTNLPAPVSDLIGRDDVLEQIQDLV